MLGIMLDYIMIGFVTICAVILVCILTAELRGYRAFDYWEDEVLPNIAKVSGSQWIWSILIWPIRVWQFIALSDILYESYKHK